MLLDKNQNLNSNENLKSLYLEQKFKIGPSLFTPE